MLRFRDLIFMDGSLGSENVHLCFYFADFIFMVCQSTANKAKFSGYTVDIVLLTSVLSVLEAELPAWPSCSDVSTWSSPEGCPIIMQDAKNIRQVQEYYCHK